MSNNRTVYLSGLGLLLAAFLSVTPALWGTEVSDSKEISALFSEARQQASQLQQEASDMESFAQSKQLSRACHMIQLNTIKERTNKVLSTLSKLNKARSTGSPSQQAAIDRINPAANDLARNIQATFEHVKEDKGETEVILCSHYRDYVTTTSALATRMAKLLRETK